MGSSESKKITNYLSSETMDPCVHCGFCLPTCASYRVLGTEMDSPRGRIHTLKAINNNEIKLDVDGYGLINAREAVRFRN